MVKFEVTVHLCCEPAVYIHDKDLPSFKRFHVRAPARSDTPYRHLGVVAPSSTLAGSEMQFVNQS